MFETFEDVEGKQEQNSGLKEILTVIYILFQQAITFDLSSRVFLDLKNLKRVDMWISIVEFLLSIT